MRSCRKWPPCTFSLSNPNCEHVYDGSEKKGGRVNFIVKGRNVCHFHHSTQNSPRLLSILYLKDYEEDDEKDIDSHLLSVRFYLRSFYISSMTFPLYVFVSSPHPFLVVKHLAIFVRPIFLLPMIVWNTLYSCPSPFLDMMQFSFKNCLIYIFFTIVTCFDITWNNLHSALLNNGNSFPPHLRDHVQGPAPHSWCDQPHLVDT